MLLRRLHVRGEIVEEVVTDGDWSTNTGRVAVTGPSLQLLPQRRHRPPAAPRPRRVHEPSGGRRVRPAAVQRSGVPAERCRRDRADASPRSRARRPTHPKPRPSSDDRRARQRRVALTARRACRPRRRRTASPAATTPTISVFHAIDDPTAGRVGRPRRRSRPTASSCSSVKRRCPLRRRVGRSVFQGERLPDGARRRSGRRPSRARPGRRDASARSPTTTSPPWSTSSRAPSRGRSGRARSSSAGTSASSTTTPSWRWPVAGSIRPATSRSSAVCTDPSARRRGYASIVTALVADAIAETGDTPMLHVADDNDAARRSTSSSAS